jgi:hypothetical protein
MSTHPPEDPRNICEIVVLSRLREALDEAYRQQQIHHKDMEEFTYWQGKVHGLEEAARIIQKYSRCGSNDGLSGPRSFGGFT